MRIFTFAIEWDQAINYSFDQDDIKTVGSRRVESSCVVVAPDKELAELHLQRSMRHRKLTITGCLETPINIFVSSEYKNINPVTDAKMIGPEVIDEHWKKAIEQDRRYS